MISQSCKYAVRAVIFLSSRQSTGLRYNVQLIAEEISAPQAFTAKLLQILNKAGIVCSLKGPYGGFYLTERQLELPLINIVESIDGLDIFKSCGLGLKNCSELKPCPLHFDYKIVREGLLNLYKNTTVAAIAEKIGTEAAFLS